MGSVKPYPINATEIETPATRAGPAKTHGSHLAQIGVQAYSQTRGWQKNKKIRSAKEWNWMAKGQRPGFAEEVGAP